MGDMPNGCQQSSFTKRSRTSDASKNVLAKWGTADMEQVFVLVHKISGERQLVVADGARRACEKMGWDRWDVYVTKENDGTEGGERQ